MSVLTESRLGSVGLSSPCGSPQSQPYGMQLDLDNLAEDVLKSDEFKMYLYKVLPCDKREQHDTGSCPFAHPGEKAARRDLRVHKYDSVACPEVLQSGRCPKGNSCTMAHSVFEYWLHPQRYRTQMCRDGPACNRKVCFFAHCEQQLRHVPGTAADTADPFSKAKFSLSGMKRQKSCSTSQASPGALYRPNGILEPAGSSSIRPLFQPGLQAWDAAAAVAGGYNLSSTVGQRRGSLDSHFYSNNLMPGSSIDRVGSSRKSNMDECTSGISGKSCFERLVLGGGAADAALVGNSPPALHYRALGSPASIQNNLAASAGGTGTETSFRHWVPNGCTLPTATAACHVQPTTACNSYNPVDPNAYLEVLSVYQQQAESCRMQAALAEAAATEAAGQLQALVAALGVPDSSSSMLAQPVNLGCSLSFRPHMQQPGASTSARPDTCSQWVSPGLRRPDSQVGSLYCCSGTAFQPGSVRPWTEQCGLSWVPSCARPGSGQPDAASHSHPGSASSNNGNGAFGPADRQCSSGSGALYTAVGGLHEHPQT